MKPVEVIKRLNENDNIIPLDKEKYFVLMDAVSELIESVNGNKEQLKSVKQEVDEMFDRAING